MKRSIIVLAALALAGPALGADLRIPTKAVAPSLPWFYGGSGFYYGFGVGAEQTKIGTAVPVAPIAPGANVYAAGGLVNVTAGWATALSPTSWAAFEVTGSMANTDANAACAVGVICNVDKKRSLDLTFMYGGPSTILSGIMGTAPTTFAPLTPTNGAAPNPSVHPFVLFGARYGQTTNSIELVAVPGVAALEEKHSKLRAKVGTGVMVQMTNSSVWLSSVDWTPGTSKSGVGLFTAPEGATLRFVTSMRYSFNGFGS